MIMPTSSISADGEKGNRKAYLTGHLLTPLTNIDSGSTDNASELRVIGSLLIRHLIALPTIRKAKGDDEHGTIEY